MPDNKISRIRAERDALSEQIKSLMDQQRGLDRALEILEEESPIPRKSVKSHILDALEFGGPIGITGDEIVAHAALSGAGIKKVTVRALISRLKDDGMVFSENGRYYLAEHQPQNLSFKLPEKDTDTIFN